MPHISSIKFSQYITYRKKYMQPSTNVFLESNREEEKREREKKQLKQWETGLLKAKFHFFFFFIATYCWTTQFHILPGGYIQI